MAGKRVQVLSLLLGVVVVLAVARRLVASPWRADRLRLTPAPPAARLPAPPPTTAPSEPAARADALPAPGTAPRSTMPPTTAEGPRAATGPSIGSSGTWVAPVDGQCPDTHPVKVKL